MKLHTRVAWFFAAWSFATPALADNCSNLKQLASLDMQPTRGDVILVPVSLNGTEMPMILDTGGGISSVTQKTADALQLKRQDAGVRALDMRGNASQQYVRIDTLGLGALKGKDLGMMIWPDHNAQFNGLIGGDILRYYDVELNFVTHKFNLFSQDHCEGKVIYWPAGALAVVPFTMTHPASGNPDEPATIRTGFDTHIRVPVTIDGKTFPAIIDTGAPITTMSANIARGAFGVTAVSPGAIPLTNSDPGDPRFGYVFHTLAFEGIAVSNPHVVIHADLVGKNDPNNSTILGSRITRMDDALQPELIIGMDVLKHLHLYIAYHEQKLYITPPDATPAAAH